VPPARNSHRPGAARILETPGQEPPDEIELPASILAALQQYQAAQERVGVALTAFLEGRGLGNERYDVRDGKLVRQKPG